MTNAFMDDSSKDLDDLSSGTIDYSVDNGFGATGDTTKPR